MELNFIFEDTKKVVVGDIENLSKFNISSNKKIKENQCFNKTEKNISFINKRNEHKNTK